VPITQAASGTYNYPGGITVEVDASANPDLITVKIPEALATGDRIFARLKATP
jgi:hypothetical protein